MGGDERTVGTVRDYGARSCINYQISHCRSVHSIKAVGVEARHATVAGTLPTRDWAQYPAAMRRRSTHCQVPAVYDVGTQESREQAVAMRFRRAERKLVMMGGERKSEAQLGCFSESHKGVNCAASVRKLHFDIAP